MANKNYKIILNANELSDLQKRNKYINSDVSSILLNRSNGCLLLWIVTDTEFMDVNEKEDFQDGGLIQKPIAINYGPYGRGDIRNKLLLQNPLKNSGVYYLDLSDSSKKFLLTEKTQCEWFPASDKVAPFYYSYIGNPSDIFGELLKMGYKFINF